ncbi:hypothetical protein JTE90_005327 [Oedothorax gibbosus]|uniref:DUF4795 domain-containing protein n=1 Tax=Oedothorax gibbosus TaxID=931172 RepID=A0AAV6UJE6_9ARAC|nr:hypothetical protein JTE90_005327 [Oedothorax gibbosus]
MLVDQFTLVELFGLALNGPESGAVNFSILLQALEHMAVSLGIGEEKPQCHIDAETVTKLGLSDSGIERSISDSDIEDSGEDVLKTGKSSTSLTSSSQEDVKEEGKEEEDTQQATDERSSDKESQTLASNLSASETKVKAEPKSEEEMVQPQDTSTTLQGMQEGWNYLRLSGRVEGLDKGVHEMSKILDLLIDKLKDVETESAETSDLAQKLVNDLGSCTVRTTKLEENVTALSKDLNDSKEHTKNEIESLEVSINEGLGSIKEELSTNMSDINIKIEEVEESITPREDFSELSVRVDQLEKVKVNREELGRFMEEGFIESFIKEHENLRIELNTLQNGVTDVDNDVKTLKKRIDEEVITYIDDSLEEVEKTLEPMKNKLDSLDADDINDTFAKLEDQTEKLTKDMEDIQTLGNRTEKEGKVNSKKFADFRDSLNKLEASKIDKSKMYELLDLKADFEALMNKLDRSEFAAIMTDIDKKVEALTSTVEITEKNLEEGLSVTRRQLSQKMYTEDFVPATEPIRNRIKAMIYEQQKIKELVLTKFLPDAPGVVKCFSCKRAANLIDEKLPPIDLDSLPIPPADQPRTRDLYKLPGQKLPALFANVKPRVGMVHQKKRHDIDKELSEYFGGVKEKKSIGGAHTKTLPNQRGLKFTTKTFPAAQKFKVLIKGVDKRIYRGSVSKETQLNLPNDDEETSKAEGSQSSEEQSYNYESQKIVYPTAVVLHRGSAPVPSMKYVSTPAPK